MGNRRKANGPIATSRNDLESSPQPSSGRPVEWNPLMDHIKDSQGGWQIVKRINNSSNELIVKRIRQTIWSSNEIIKRTNWSSNEFVRQNIIVKRYLHRQTNYFNSSNDFLIRQTNSRFVKRIRLTKLIPSNEFRIRQTNSIDMSIRLTFLVKKSNEFVWFPYIRQTIDIRQTNNQRISNPSNGNLIVKRIRQTNI